jgi:hypothetical protein
VRSADEANLRGLDEMLVQLQATTDLNSVDAIMSTCPLMSSRTCGRSCFQE